MAAFKCKMCGGDLIIEKGSTVAVSTYMVSEHGSHKDQKDFMIRFPQILTDQERQIGSSRPDGHHAAHKVVNGTSDNVANGDD